MNFLRALLILSLSAGPSFAAGDQWAASVADVSIQVQDFPGVSDAKAEQAPARPNPLLVFVADDGGAPMPAAIEAMEQAGKLDWPSLEWRSGAALIYDLSSDIVILGNGKDAAHPLESIVRAALASAPEHPVVVHFAMDAVYGLPISREQGFKEALIYFHDILIPQAVPKNASLYDGKELVIELQDHGRRYAEPGTKGRGYVHVLIEVDLTDWNTLAPGALVSPAAPSADGHKRGRMPGSPLDTASGMGLWWGKGNQDSDEEGVRGTVSQMNGQLSYAHGEFQFRDPALFNSGSADQSPLAFMHVDYNNDPTAPGGTGAATVDMGAMGDNHGFSARYYQNQNGILDNKLVSGSYYNHESLAFRTGQTNSELASDASVHAGYMMTSVDLQAGSLPGSPATENLANQFLYGAGDTISYALHHGSFSVVAETGLDAAWASVWGQNQWDNTNIHGGVETDIPIPLVQGLHTMLQYKQQFQEFNTQRYFFADQKASDQKMAMVAYDQPDYGVGVLGAVETIKGSEADDLQRKAGVWVRVFKTTANALLNRGEWTNEYMVNVSHQVTKDLNTGIFADLKTNTDGSGHENKFGANFAYKWGPGGQKSALPDERDYHEANDGLYAKDYSHQADPSTYAQFAGGSVSDSLRSMNQFMGSYFTWGEDPSVLWARTPPQCYLTANCKCDEQALFVSQTLNDNPVFRQNGGQAYVLDLWTLGGGHGVSLVDEKGRVFVNQYGQNFLVNVPANAPLQVQATAAMKQIGQYLALPSVNGQPLLYQMYGTNYQANDPYNYSDDPVTPQTFATAWQNDPSNHPPVETGIGAVLGNTNAFSGHP